MSAADDTTCVRLEDGTARCFGAGTNGELGNGATGRLVVTGPGPRTDERVVPGGGPGLRVRDRRRGCEVLGYQLLPPARRGWPSGFLTRGGPWCRRRNGLTAGGNHYCAIRVYRRSGDLGAVERVGRVVVRAGRRVCRWRARLPCRRAPLRCHRGGRCDGSARWRRRPRPHRGSSGGPGSGGRWRLRRRR